MTIAQFFMEDGEYNEAAILLVCAFAAVMLIILGVATLSPSPAHLVSGSTALVTRANPPAYPSEREPTHPQTIERGIAQEDFIHDDSAQNNFANKFDHDDFETLLGQEIIGNQEPAENQDELDDLAFIQNEKKEPFLAIQHKWQMIKAEDI